MATQQEIAQLFTTMQERFQTDKADGVDTVIQFDLSGDNGGQYWVKVVNNTCEVGSGTAENPKMTLKAAADDWLAVASGKMNAMQAFMSGKLKISGDMGVAFKLQSMFGMG